MANTTKKTRVQFDFSPEAYQEISELEKILQVPTKAEVVRMGLRTLQWLTEAIHGGETILVEDKTGRTREVIFPFVSRKKS